MEQVLEQDGVLEGPQECKVAPDWWTEFNWQKPDALFTKTNAGVSRF